MPVNSMQCVTHLLLCRTFRTRSTLLGRNAVLTKQKQSELQLGKIPANTHYFREATDMQFLTSRTYHDQLAVHEQKQKCFLLADQRWVDATSIGRSHVDEY